MKNLIRRIGYICLVSLLFVSCDDNLLEEDGFIDREPDGWGGLLPANPFWDWVDAFPGPISSKLPRLGNDDSVVFFVNGDYKDLVYVNTGWGDTLPSPSPWFAPGLWAAIMEPVTINVPAGINNLNCLIGTQTSPLNERTPVKERWDDVQDTIRLHPGKNVVSSFFGGMIYFYWENGTKPVKPGTTVTIKGGCVRANNYIKGVTDYDTWIQSIKDLYVKDTIGVDDNGNVIVQESRKPALDWVELEGDYVILTVRYDDFKACANPGTLLDVWDKYILASLEYYGFPYEEGQPKRRVITDIQLNAQWSMFGFYPHQLRIYHDIEKFMWDYDIMTCKKDGGRWAEVIFNILWKDMRSQVFGSGWFGQDLISKFFAYYYAQRMYNCQPTTNHIDVPFLLSDENPKRHQPMRRQDVPTRMAAMLQLVNEYGWSLMPYVSHAGRLTHYRPYDREVAGVDRFAMHAAEYCNANLNEFFRFWHWEISSFAQDYLKKFPEPSNKFWLTYRDKIADWHKPVPPINSPLTDTIPQLWETNKNMATSWKITSGFAQNTVRNVLDGNRNTYMMADNVAEEDAWIQFDCNNDTLHFNEVRWNNPSFFNVNAYSIRVKYGWYTDDSKTTIDWKYITDPEGQPEEFILDANKNGDQKVFLSQMYSAQVVRVEVVNVGEQCGWPNNAPVAWPHKLACADLRFGRYSIPRLSPTAPYPYVPPVNN